MRTFRRILCLLRQGRSDSDTRRRLRGATWLFVMGDTAGKLDPRQTFCVTDIHLILVIGLPSDTGDLSQWFFFSNNELSTCPAPPFPAQRRWDSGSTLSLYRIDDFRGLHTAQPTWRASTSSSSGCAQRCPTRGHHARASRSSAKTLPRVRRSLTGWSGATLRIFPINTPKRDFCPLSWSFTSNTGNIIIIVSACDLQPRVILILSYHIASCHIPRVNHSR